VRAATRAPIVSHGAGAGFASEFAWDGCRDYAGALALPALPVSQDNLLEAWKQVYSTEATENVKASMQ
jgi:hypothetical protein